MSLVYEGSLVSGESPFQYDRQETQSHLSWDFLSDSRATLRISGGIDVARAAFDPLAVSLSFGRLPSWDATLTYDLSTARLDNVNVRIAATHGPYDGRADLTYDAVSGRFEPLSFDISAAAAASEWTMSGELTHGRLSALQGSYELRDDSGWGLTASATYGTATPNRLSSVSYGVFRDIAECLRVGIERRGGAVWIYGSVLAFPEAILRYAPERAQLQLGD